VEFYVYLEQSVDASFLYIFFIAPPLIRGYELSELRSPVSEVIDTYGFVAEFIERTIEARAYRSIEKMSDVERLCDVYRRIVDTYRFSVRFCLGVFPFP